MKSEREEKFTCKEECFRLYFFANRGRLFQYGAFTRVGVG